MVRRRLLVGRYATRDQAAIVQKSIAEAFTACRIVTSDVERLAALLPG